MLISFGIHFQARNYACGFGVCVFLYFKKPIVSAATIHVHENFAGIGGIPNDEFMFELDVNFDVIKKDEAKATRFTQLNN
jgi:hypothetical protein